MDDTALTKIASRLRYLILKTTHTVGSGHPTTCFSSVELAAMLFFKYLRLDPAHPERLSNDRVIFSKGHASALLYSLYTVAGVLTEKELSGYRTFKSPLEGHPTFRFPLANAATGSLGQGLSIGAGYAWGLRRKFTVHSSQLSDPITHHPSPITNSTYDATLVPFSIPRVFVLMGDGELAEGSNWEAAAWASHQKLSNLIAIVDVNRFGQSEETMEAGNSESFRAKFEAFGWGAIVVDGHDWGQLDAAYEKAVTYHSGPVAIIAKTVKGKGIPVWEDKNGWHNKMLSLEEFEKWLDYFKKESGDVKGVIQKPEMVMSDGLGVMRKNTKINPLPITNYQSPTATKLAFGNALVRLGETIENLLVLDADVSNSVHTDMFAKSYPKRFLPMHIAEQNMTGVALGLSKMGYLPVINTFGAFLTRAHDQLRMMPLSDGTVIVHGSYVGVSLGRDGPSQMGLEDIVLFRSIYGSTVLYPSDPYQTEKLVEEALKLHGVVYVRTTREPTPVIYDEKTKFHIGGSYVFEPRTTNHEPITIIAAGITLHEALKAQQELAKKKISVRVIDCYSIKPIDEKTLQKAANDSKAIIVVEDHYPEGGLGDAVRSVVGKIHHLAVTKLPRSGSAAELLHEQGIDAEGIVRCIMRP